MISAGFDVGPDRMTALTPEQILIRQTAADFAAERLRPVAGEWDEKKHFPVDVIREAAGLGFAGLYVNEDVGGSALSRFDAVLVFEKLSQGCVSTAAYISISTRARTARRWIQARPPKKTRLLRSVGEACVSKRLVYSKQRCAGAIF